MGEDLANYRQRPAVTHYFERVGAGAPLSRDSLNVYQSVLFSYTQINPRISRFEALKGSGKLGIIENKELLLHIIDLYTKDFALIRLRNDFINSTKETNLIPYLTLHLELDVHESGTNWETLLRSSPMRILVFQGESAQSNMDAYTMGIGKCRTILKEIDEELK